MNWQRMAVIVNALNLALLTFLLAQYRHVSAQDVTPVLRGRALEIVDQQGRVRAQLKVFPSDPKVRMPDGTTGYPEAVLLRLVSSKGRPNVKIAATEDGSAVALGGDSDPTYIQLLARGADPLVKLTNRGGKQQLIEP